MLECGAGLHPGRWTPLAPGLQGRAQPAGADREEQRPEAQCGAGGQGHTIPHPNKAWPGALGTPY